MKPFIKVLCLSLLAVMTGNSSLRAQWNTLEHDATTNRSLNDVYFVSSTGYAVGWHADNVSWGTRGLIYKTTDGGLNWTTTFLPLLIGNDSIMGLKCVQFLTPSKGYAVATCYTTNNVSGLYYGALLQTTDGGTTWTTNYSTKNLVNYSTGNTTDLNHVHFYDAYSAVLSGRQRTSSSNYNGITFHTTNGGNNWISSTAYNGSQANASFFFSNGRGSVVGGKMQSLSGPYDGRIALSTNGGGSWSTTYTDPGYAYVDVHFPTTQIGYAVGDSMYFTTAGASNGKLVKTTDGGATWTAAAIFQNFMPLTVFFTDAMTGYVGGQTAAGNSGILKTTDGGITWTPENYPDIAMNSNITSITFSSPVSGYAANAWASSNSVYGNFQQSCGVFLGPDTSFCQQTGQLFATPATPGNDYVFAWSPATGLSDPTSPSPYVSHVSNQQYVVTMTDTVTNCVATDTIIVSAYEIINSPVYLCPGDTALLDFGPGASQYAWQSFTDTSGNTFSLFNQNVQQLLTMDPGTYFGYATFPGCGSITSMVQVIDSCVQSSNCSNIISFANNQQACVDSVVFVGTGSGNVTNWSWDMGDGNVLSGPTLSVFYYAYTAGTYTVTLTTTDNTNCTATSSVVITATGGFSVDAGADTTFCQQTGQLNAVTSVPGNYTYSWSPANRLSNPNIANPMVTDGVYNQPYVVTVTDNTSGCMAMDTVIVSAAYFHLDTVYSCNNQPVTLDLGPGATFYTWMSFTDTAGNNTPINQNTQTYVATQPGQYFAGGTFPNCGSLTSIFTVIDSCNVSVANVWPGDCNYDLSANMADALQIGLAYNTAGPVRPSASPLWYAQPMSDWPQSFTNCNYKHADADGNGMIDVNDTVPIALNYGNTHPFRLGAPAQIPATAPALYLVANYDTVGLQTLVTVDIRLGSTTIPVDSIYGISFRITTDAQLIDTNLTGANLASTWLGTPGTDMFNFRKNFADAGVIDIAECGSNHLNRVNGNGSIGSFLIVTTDNLSGIAVCHFNLSDITAVTIGQQYLTLNTVNDSVVIDPSQPAGIAPEAAAQTFSYYPNPANNSVTVQTGAVAEKIEICDMTGRVVISETPTAATATIGTAQLASGVYLLRVYNGTTVTTQKLTISR